MRGWRSIEDNRFTNQNKLHIYDIALWEGSQLKRRLQGIVPAPPGFEATTGNAALALNCLVRQFLSSPIAKIGRLERTRVQKTLKIELICE